MGYSSGVTFICRHNGKVHWEAKSRGLALWGEQELTQPLRLEWDEAVKAYEDLDLMLRVAGKHPDQDPDAS
jgi:hypothetical protein